MSHIIGRPDEDVLEVMLGHGADPEQAFIGGSEQGVEEATASRTASPATSAPSPRPGADHSQPAPAVVRPPDTE